MPRNEAARAFPGLEANSTSLVGCSTPVAKSYQKMLLKTIINILNSEACNYKGLPGLSYNQLDNIGFQSLTNLVTLSFPPIGRRKLTLLDSYC